MDNAAALQRIRRGPLLSLLHGSICSLYSHALATSGVFRSSHLMPQSRRLVQRQRAILPDHNLSER